MAGPDSSSEEFVDDDSGEEEEEEEDEEEASSASLDSEDDGHDLEGDVSEDEIFQSKQPARKKAKSQAGAVVAKSSPKDRKAAEKAPKSGSAASQKTGGGSAGSAAAGDAGEGGAGAKGKGRAPAPKANPSTAIDSDMIRGTPTGETSSGTLSGTPSTPVVPCTPVEDTPTKSSSSGSSSGKKTGGGGAKTPKAAVWDYMTKANRPYSVINVFDNLHKKVPKPMVQKLLDELVRDGTVKLQEFGKSKIYYANQNTLPNGAGDVSDAKLARLEKEAKDLTQRLQVVSAQAREAQSRAQALASQPTDVSLDEQLASTAQEIDKLEARNKLIRDQGHSVVAGSMETAKKDFNKYRALWVSRKRSAMDVVDMISDGMEKKPKQVMEMIGVEPDEEPIPPKM